MYVKNFHLVFVFTVDCILHPERSEVLSVCAISTEYRKPVILGDTGYEEDWRRCGDHTQKKLFTSNMSIRVMLNMILTFKAL